MSAKKKTLAQPVVKETTGITLQVPSLLYFNIKGKADTCTLNTGSKKTIHDKMIDDLYKANPDCKRE